MRFHQGRQKERKGFGSEDFYKERFLRHRHGGFRGGFGGHGEGRRRFFERGEFKFALLELLATEPMHGYQLIKAMEEKTGGLYTPSAGSVYPNLQLLEDMQLITSSETDGKKLYQITDAGRAHLNDRGKAETSRPGNPWERHGQGRQRSFGGRHGKPDLRAFMKEWSEVIYLMASAADAAEAHPASEQAAQFQVLITQFQKDLQGLLPAFPNGSTEEAKKPPADEASSASDDQQEE